MNIELALEPGFGEEIQYQVLTSGYIARLFANTFLPRKIYSFQFQKEMMHRVKVTVPGSTSNFGSGFDTLGMAINRYQQLEMVRNGLTEIRLRSVQHDRSIDSRLRNLVEEASSQAFQAYRAVPFGFDLALGGDLPVGKGLGASGALRLGIVAGLGHLSGVRPRPCEVLNLAAKIEHHPDNVSPAFYGGFTVSSLVGCEVTCVSVKIDQRLRFVTAIPDFGMDTEEARKLIPASFSRQDVVHALNRAAMIAAVFTTGNYEKLRGLFDDRFHQPYRQKLLPQLSEVIQAGVEAGALGGWLSGAGSGIMCVTTRCHEQVAAAMQAALPGAEILILEADNQGIQMDSSAA